MSEAKYSMEQKVAVELAETVASVTIKVTYENPESAKEFLRRITEFCRWCGEYPNAQLDLLRGVVTSLPAGDSRTEPKTAKRKSAAPKADA